ncbi:flavin reductase family protein [Thalassomonas sp. M1454]|uniref:flavin reductase family protein n=1 Tax=Thalassomonas sp. M1454 TaxID=2594477 RepID=UPI00117C17C8|nr:flavin reductase family protein [Thalassomonas sp. M1454]TRX54987.1 flavin reductase family protein [Thalassomonas sp. M1454]
MTNPGIDPIQFRNALGKFPTGVTIVTTKFGDELIGMTISSFNSVSLDPPLILWSIDKGARSLPAFKEASNFAVHVLCEDQQEVSNLFARQGADKFANVELETGIGDVPMLKEYSARFQCQVEHQYEGGDHVIIVGRVLDFDAHDCKDPLVFHSGRYAKIASE